MPIRSASCRAWVLLLMGLTCLPSVTAQQGAPPATSAEGAGPSGPDQPAAASEASHPAELFVERIAGTTVDIELLLLPLTMPLLGGSGSAPDPGSAPIPARTLWMSRCEITWDAFDVFIHRLDKPDPEVPDELDALVTPSLPFVLADRGYGHAGHPVISVNHTLAAAFCAWLSAKTGRPYRLPTQAEWQTACAAGDPSWIESSAQGLRPFAWVRQDSERRTHPVGTLAPNPWGLADMLGNAAEWCLDPDGTAVLRGGSFRDKAQDVGLDTVAHPSPAWNATDPQLPRSKWWLADGDFAGFRVVCDEALGGD